MMGEDYCVGYGRGVSCTEVRARAVLVTRDGFAIPSLRYSLALTSFGSSILILGETDFTVEKISSATAALIRCREMIVGGFLS